MILTHHKTVIALALVACVAITGTAFRAQPVVPPSPALPQPRWTLLPAPPLNADGFRLLTYRAAVPGGWLVAVVGRIEPTGTVQAVRPGEVPTGLSFIPDPDHAWNGEAGK